MKQWSISYKKSDGHWHTVGRAFEGKKGISLVINSLPCPMHEWDGSFMMFPVTDKSPRGKRKRKDISEYLPEDDRHPDFDQPF